MPTRVSRKIYDATAAARQSVAVYRKNREAMGLRQRSAYVPDNYVPEFNLFCDKIRAMHMIDLLKEGPESPARLAMAQCNYTAVPDTSTVNLLLRDSKDQVVRGMCRDLVRHLENYMTARHGLNMVEVDEKEMVNFASRAVAHNYMAAYLWGAIQERLEEHPLQGGDNQKELT